MEIQIRPGQVKVPRTIILNPGLTPTAKVTWAGYQLRPRGVRELAELSGLSRTGAQSGLAVLRRLNLCRTLPVPQRPGSWAAIPVDLLRSHLPAQAKVMYATVQLLPGFQESTVAVTYDQLCTVTGCCLNTVKRALDVLRSHAWIGITRPGRYGSFFITVINPHAESQARAVAQVTRRLDRAKYRGEALMRELLTIAVDRDDYEDDASPGFLINPYTMERMRIDRIYWPDAGFEFNGPQHYVPTELFPSLEQVRYQRARDLMKQAICQQRGIQLVLVHSEDLSLSGILRLIPDRLPRRCLDGQEMLVAYVESLCRSYRQRAPLPLPRPNQAPLGAAPRGTN